MRNIKMILEYDGSRYQGWQRLGDSDRTIQGKLEEVISQMTESKIEIIGSGRTDAVFMPALRLQILRQYLPWN